MGPKRFKDLQKTLPRIRPNILTARLRELEAAGVLRRHWLGTPTSAWVYELTDWGRQLEPVLIQLARWSLASPAPRPHAPVSANSVLLALQTRFDPARAQDVVARVAIDLDDQRFALNIDRGRLDIRQTDIAGADATLTTDQETLRELVINDHPLDEAEHDGRVRITGDRAVLRRVLDAAVDRAP
jgi:HxlR-like helix-turn-helix protein/alkyl sulfatase-like protein